MKRHSRSLFIFSLVVVLMLVGGSYHKAFAAKPTGVYDIFTFPGATSTDCGTWAIYSTDGVNQPGPSNYTETMTDGNGTVIFSRSQVGGIGFYTFWGSGTFTKQPKANPIRDYVVMDGVVIIDVSADNPCLPPPAYRGAPIPGGFVLRTITCDTPVYDTAGGSPLSTGEKVTAGQSWFVSPTPQVVGATSWTEIFNAGLLDGFIPTACVGGKPAGYLGD
jgi:hypothetical protein